MQQELEAAAEAKHQLMRELNHRVKNNLHMVSTLISLKDASLGSTADLSDIRGQVSTISYLHEKLYGRDAVRHVEFEPYARDLLTDVFSFSTEGDLDLAVEIHVGSLPADTAATPGADPEREGTPPYPLVALHLLSERALDSGFTRRLSHPFLPSDLDLRWHCNS